MFYYSVLLRFVGQITEIYEAELRQVILVVWPYVVVVALLHCNIGGFCGYTKIISLIIEGGVNLFFSAGLNIHQTHQGCDV